MIKQQSIFWGLLIVSILVAASIAMGKPGTIAESWTSYTNTTYGYSVKYPNDYTPSGTPELSVFRKGLLQGDPTHTIYVYSLTEENHREVEKYEFSGKSGWYDWATSEFPDDGSIAASLSRNKRQETYGTNTYTVVNYDAASGWNGAPIYFFVNDKTVFLITEHRVGEFDDSILQTMLASFNAKQQKFQNGL